MNLAVGDQFADRTSRYYDVAHVLHFIIPLSIFYAALVVLGGYLILKSIYKMRLCDRHIHQLKQKYSAISEFIE